MSIVLGLQAPTSGRTLVGGRAYRDLDRPLHEVGALLDAAAVHSGRNARAHLLWVAQSNGISSSRVDEVLGIVGLDSVAGKRLRGYSLGMKQRLGIAQALLGNAPVLIFDEPVIAFAAMVVESSGRTLRTARLGVPGRLTRPACRPAARVGRGRRTACLAGHRPGRRRPADATPRRLRPAGLGTICAWSRTGIG